MSIIPTLGALIPIFVVIALGKALSLTLVRDDAFWAGLEKICFFVLFPALLLQTLAGADLSNLTLSAIAIAFALAVAVQAALLLAIRPVLRTALSVDDPAFSSVFQGATRWHGFIALAVVTALYDERAITVVAVAIAVLMPLLNVLSIGVLLHYGRRTAAEVRPRFIRQVLLNPFILTIALGLAMNALGLTLGGPVATAVGFLAGGALGLSLLTVGAGLKPPSGVRAYGVVGFCTVFRLVLNPVIVFAMFTLMSLDGIERTVGVICAAVPTAASSYVMARQLGGDAPLMATIITVQICVAAITLPLAIFLAEAAQATAAGAAAAQAAVQVPGQAAVQATGQ